VELCDRRSMIMEYFQDERNLFLPQINSLGLCCKIKIPLKRTVIYKYENWIGVLIKEEG